jgi:MFS family permease
LITGRLIDRWGARRVIASSVTLLSLAAASIWFSHSLGAFIILFGIAAFLGSGQTTVPYADILSAWFDSRRGLALGVAMAGIGLGTALLPQVAQFLIGRGGWREAYVGLAAIAFVAAQSAVVLWIRAPGGAGARAEPNRRAYELPGVSGGEAARSPLFWRLAISIFLVVTAIVGMSVHLVPLLTDHGVSKVAATAVLSAMGASQLLGRIVGGYSLDRFHAPKVAAFFFATPILGFALLAIPSGNGVLLFLSAFLIGVSLGAEMDLMAFMVSRYFGLRAFGEVFGYLFVVFNLGASLGPIVMGVSFDRTGSYQPALIGLGVCLAVASFLISRLGAYRYPSAEALSRDASRMPTIPA